MCVHCREPRLIFALLTAQPLFTLKMRWAKIKPQFRASACLVFSVQSTQADKRTLIQGVLIHGMCNFEDGTRATRRRALERRAGALVCVVQATAPCCWPRLAHKAQWHNERTILIYASADFPPCERCLFLQRNGASLSNRGKPEGKG